MRRHEPTVTAAEWNARLDRIEALEAKRPAVGDRIRVRELEPGTWASSMVGQCGEVERVDGIDLLVRMDGESPGGVQAWLQVHEVDVLPREEQAR